MTFSQSEPTPLTQAQCLTDAAAPAPSAPASPYPAPSEERSPAPAAAEKEPFPTPEEVRAALSKVEDPELGLNIVELGLVYEILCDPQLGSVTVKMTLTSPGCPLGAEITSAAYLSIARLPGVKDCQVDLVWSPMWDPEKHPSEEAKAALGLW